MTAGRGSRFSGRTVGLRTLFTAQAASDFADWLDFVARCRAAGLRLERRAARFRPPRRRRWACRMSCVGPLAGVLVDRVPLRPVDGGGELRQGCRDGGVCAGRAMGNPAVAGAPAKLHRRLLCPGETGRAEGDCGGARPWRCKRAEPCGQPDVENRRARCRRGVAGHDRPKRGVPVQCLRRRCGRAFDPAARAAATQRDRGQRTRAVRLARRGLQDARGNTRGSRRRSG